MYWATATFACAPTHDCTERVTVLAPCAPAKGEDCLVMSAAPQPVVSASTARDVMIFVRVRGMSRSLLRVPLGRLGHPVEHQAEADDRRAGHQTGRQVAL